MQTIFMRFSVLAPALWLAHGIAYFSWLFVDHDSAVTWMWLLGNGVYAHCFDDGAFGGHVLELQSTAQSTGLILGFLGVLSALVAVTRSPDNARRSTLFLALVVNLLLLIPGAGSLAYAMSRY